MDDRTDLRLDDEGDAKITEMLRDAYAPPAHKQVVIPVNWWSDLANWSAPGLAAAALLFIAAGVMWSRQNDDDMSTSYDAVTEVVDSDVLPGAIQVITAPHDRSSQREATFRYVLSH